MLPCRSCDRPFALLMLPSNVRVALRVAFSALAERNGWATMRVLRLLVDDTLERELGLFDRCADCFWFRAMAVLGYCWR